MRVRVQTRIEALTEFVELLEVIGISKDYGSGLDEAMRNEIGFLKSIFNDLPDTSLSEKGEK